MLAPKGSRNTLNSPNQIEIWPERIATRVSMSEKSPRVPPDPKVPPLLDDTRYTLCVECGASPLRVGNCF
jgi:hypothetical protein